MIKVVRQKSDVNIGSNKLSTNIVSNSTMGALNRIELMTTFRTRRIDSEAVSFKELSNFSRTIHFSTMIEGNIPGIETFKTVRCKPITEIF